MNIDIEKFQQETQKFKSEEDVRAETNRFLKNSCEHFGINLSAVGHEVTSIYGGRADSMYSDIIIEYKSPQINLLAKKGFDEVVYGRNEKDRGLRDYLVNFSLEATHGDETLFLTALLNKIGVGFNGTTFIFARFVPSSEKTELFLANKTKAFPKGIQSQQCVSLKIETIDNLELGMKKLFLYLRSTNKKRLSSINLLNSFGPESELCRNSVASIHDCLHKNINDNNLRVITLFKEWNRIFGDVYGEKETDFTSIRQSLLSLYGIKDIKQDIRSIIFSIQTYYNIILKLIVFDLLNSLNNPINTCPEINDISGLYRLFSGKSIDRYNIQNFFEVHFFEWFVYARDFDISIINNALLEIDEIEATASVIKPEVVEDVFREVYNGLMPKNIRHLLGEYYTPAWLVEFVLNKANYKGQKDLTLLDPTCGSGSFVTHAIKRYITTNGNNCDSSELIEKITNQIVGYDINPITVITAKTNYILSLGDITMAKKEINIPIYMCDSILVPTVHAKQNEVTHSIKVKTIVGEFEIPVFKTRVESDAFMREVSSHVENYTFDEFIEYLKYNKIISLDGVKLDVARMFYNRICELHLSSQDSFWGIILKNAFAPLFSRNGFDIVVGNPPWIAWKAMSDTYRLQTLDIWLSYGIFEKSAYDKITTHDDFAMAVTYVSIDHYCKENGELVFVLPQTFLKSSKGGEGFRKFSITRDGLQTPFEVTEVYDMLKIQPFRGIANNKTSVIKFTKNKEMKYPMKAYYECVPNGTGTLQYNDNFETAISKFTTNQMQAMPISIDDFRSPWLTMCKNEMERQNKFLGKSPYKGRKGIEPCGAKGIYLVDIEKKINNDIIIKNLIERSRLAKAKELGTHKGAVENDFVFPMVGGRNIDKWGINSYIYMLVPHYTAGDGIYRGIPENELKIKYPKTFDWLMYFHDLLLETRIRSGKFFDKKQYPFYRLDNVGPYTFQPYHVVWREQNKTMVSCVISTLSDEKINEKIVVTDSKVLFCSFENEYEAHYLCAIINSPTIANIIESYTIDTQRGVDILNNIKIPKYDEKNLLHKELAQNSLKAHQAYIDKESFSEIDNAIDKLVHRLFE